MGEGDIEYSIYRPLVCQFILMGAGNRKNFISS